MADPIDSTRSLLPTAAADDTSPTQPADADTSPTPARPAPPDPAGHPSVPGYDVLGELGRGAMGVVYHARQAGLNRPAALKMVLGHARADSKEIIRFLAEAEAVAAIRHPHVIGVYEYGDHTGRPFLALEYCPGGTLADRLRAAGRFPPRAAAGLVRKLAAGVAAAHDLGIVHRDLKPGNVLFDPAGEPKVSDFGLAKKGAGNDMTRTRTVMGTPAYMAPEQALGFSKFVGPQADVWALGVILYECLTGRKPFEADDAWAVIRQVIAVEPAAVRSVTPDVPRDLDLICRKCLAKAPHERYLTAGELADDLGRFLDGKPTLARRAGWAGRAAKWVRRNPVPAAFLAAVSVLAGVAGWMAYRAEQARADTAAALGRETAEKTEKEDALRRVTDLQAKTTAALATAEETLAAVTDTAVAQTLGRQVRATRPAGATAGGYSGPEQAFLRRVLAAHERYAAAVGSAGGGDVIRAHGQARVARLREHLGELAAAEDGYRAARDEFARLADRPDLRALAASTRIDLARVLARRGRAADAEAEIRQGVADLRRLAADHPTQSDYRDRLAAALISAAVRARETGRTTDELRADEEVLRLRSALADEKPADLDRRTKLADAELNLGAALSDAVKPAEALAAYRRAKAVLTGIAAATPDDPDAADSLALACFNLAVQLQADDPDAGAAEYRQARNLWQKLAAAFPAVPAYRANLGSARLNLGDLLHSRGKPEEAAAEFRAARELFDALTAEQPGVPDHKHWAAAARYNLAVWWHAGRQEWAAAAELLRASYPLHQAAVAAAPARTDFRTGPAQNREALALVLAGGGDHAGAAAAAAELAAMPDDPVRNPADAAACWAEAAAAANKDTTLPADRRAELAKGYADKAIAALTTAVERGYRDAEAVADNPKFAPVRDRPEFKALLDRMKAAAPPRPAKP